MSAKDYSRLAALNFCHCRIAAIGTCRQWLAHYGRRNKLNPVVGRLGGLRCRCCPRLAGFQHVSKLRLFRRIMRSIGCQPHFHS